MNRILCILTATLLGCSAADDGDSKPDGVRNQINDCATRGASYLNTFQEHSGGTCGPIPDRVVNIDDPAITASTCSSVTQENCVARATACKYSDGGCDFTETYMTTFAQDGSSAAATASIWIECSDGSYCSSTYDVTMRRL